jgi:hypothetical protein
MLDQRDPIIALGVPERLELVHGVVDVGWLDSWPYLVNKRYTRECPTRRFGSIDDNPDPLVLIGECSPNALQIFWA